MTTRIALAGGRHDSTRPALSPLKRESAHSRPSARNDTTSAAKAPA
ncbi:hypothetical protein ACFQGX_03035 [Nonomuraea dietziae]